MEALDFESLTDEERVTLKVNKEKLENAPGFDKENWPQNSDASFLDQVYSHYGYERTARETRGIII